MAVPPPAPLVLRLAPISCVVDRVGNGLSRTPLPAATELAFIANSSETWRCGLFHLTEDASGQRLRYDCPKYPPVVQGNPVSLQICTREHTVTYRFRLPHFENISCKFDANANCQL